VLFLFVCCLFFFCRGWWAFSIFYPLGTASAALRSQAAAGSMSHFQGTKICLRGNIHTVQNHIHLHDNITNSAVLFFSGKYIKTALQFSFHKCLKCVFACTYWPERSKLGLRSGIRMLKCKSIKFQRWGQIRFCATLKACVTCCSPRQLWPMSSDKKTSSSGGKRVMKRHCPVEGWEVNENLSVSVLVQSTGCSGETEGLSAQTWVEVTFYVVLWLVSNISGCD